MALQKPTETLTRDNLFAALQLMPVVTGTWQIQPNQGVLKRGTLISEAGKKCAKTAAEGGEPDGEGTPETVDDVYCILADDIDTGTCGAVTAPGYFTGDFNQDALIFDTANSAKPRDFMVSARKVGIFFRTNI
jgi:hypothetical protein